MEARLLQVERREQKGKGTAHKLRASGRIPAVCYGRGSEPVPLSLAPEALSEALDKTLGTNTPLRLAILADGASEERLVMLKDRQFDPLSRKLLHADFVEIREGEKLRVEVPLRLTGKPVGVKNGGTLSQPRRRLLVECVPSKIPAEISIDVSGLDLGESIHIKELLLPDGVAAVFDVNFTIAVVVAPTREEAPVAPAEESVEGEPKKDEGEAKKVD